MPIWGLLGIKCHTWLKLLYSYALSYEPMGSFYQSFSFCWWGNHEVCWQLDSTQAEIRDPVSCFSGQYPSPLTALDALPTRGWSEFSAAPFLIVLGSQNSCGEPDLSAYPCVLAIVWPPPCMLSSADLKTAHSGLWSGQVLPWLRNWAAQIWLAEGFMVKREASLQAFPAWVMPRTRVPVERVTLSQIRSQAGLRAWSLPAITPRPPTTPSSLSPERPVWGVTWYLGPVVV